MEIYGTLGPSCADREILAGMLEAGMTGIRLNLSHTTVREAERALDEIRCAEKLCGLHAGLLMDLQGPEMRIGVLREPMQLNPGEKVRLHAEGIPLEESVRREIEKGDRLLLDDGRIELEALSGDEARVIRGGCLKSRKSIAIEGKSVQGPALTQMDRENIRDAVAQEIDAVMQPFVRSEGDLREVRQALDDCGGKTVRLMAKIENLDGVRHLSDFFGHADEIVIARGDLGNAVPLWHLPCVQKEIASRCRMAGVPFMVVTQMLSSMEHSAVPTRAEVSDIFNAVLDGAASLMVTSETAVGEYPVEVIRILARTAGDAVQYRESGGTGRCGF